MLWAYTSAQSHVERQNDPRFTIIRDTPVQVNNKKVCPRSTVKVETERQSQTNRQTDREREKERERERERERKGEKEKTESH